MLLIPVLFIHAVFLPYFFFEDGFFLEFILMAVATALCLMIMGLIYRLDKKFKEAEKRIERLIGLVNKKGASE
ncbi:MAG: hypothetical protein GF370_00790 [Candidatus Nealsonbacteria bacterium]|nr:hypothetical protein [Candidatus Nealsonbacteria bacterium]